MGKGDNRTKKGKIVNKSFGSSRPKRAAKTPKVGGSASLLKQQEPAE